VGLSFENRLEIHALYHIIAQCVLPLQPAPKHVRNNEPRRAFRA
jgi:hypothetical protein